MSILCWTRNKVYDHCLCTFDGTRSFAEAEVIVVHYVTTDCDVVVGVLWPVQKEAHQVPACQPYNPYCRNSLDETMQGLDAHKEWTCKIQQVSNYNCLWGLSGDQACKELLLHTHYQQHW